MYIEQDPIKAIERTKQLQDKPTIFLLDLDAIYNIKDEEDDDKTLLECSYSTCCSTATEIKMDNTKRTIHLISKLTRDLNTLSNHVPLIGS